MDDHSPARRNNREPDPETAESGAQNGAADTTVPGSQTSIRRQPPDDTGTPDPASPLISDDRDADAPGGADGMQRSGNDERQRGWFWHWNGIVTQFAPLIGLKGVGLLNSYTVWTDRREDSPHRGYAFPSQQSEANFYGEDRAELITINKILVALDLIEVRKEMVLKVDEQGRRWRVPHNFYRVKDRPNGLNLTAGDVIRVVELAERDAAVYRYIRKVFSSKFEPIDRDNVWHRILPEVASHPSWQKLSEKAARQEARASARTRAGHQSRNKAGKKQREDKDAGGKQDEDTILKAEMTSGHNSASASSNTQQQGAAAQQKPATVATANNGSPTDVGRVNSGFEISDEEVNNGSTGAKGAKVAATNTGEPGIVEPGNTTYYQSSTTTTTTSSHPVDDSESQAASSDIAHGDKPASRPTGAAALLVDSAGRGLVAPIALRESERSADDPDLASDGDAGGGAPQRSAAPAGGQGPVGDPSPLVVSLFEAANDRRATPLERILLSELERDAAGPAQAAGSTGADWVAAALREAVGSGSAFVAPKRIREIINRWAAEGAGPRGVELARSDGSDLAVPSSPPNRHRDGEPDDMVRTVASMLEEWLGDDIELSSVDVKQGGGAVDLLVSLSGIDRDIAAHQRLRLERELAGEFGQPVRLRFSTDGHSGRGDMSPGGQPVYTVAAGDVARGRQLWLAVLDDLSTRLPASDLARMREVAVLGQGEQGEVYIGTSNRLALRYLSGRYRDDVQRSLGRLLGSSISVVILNQDQWQVSDPAEG